jgi:iron complex outermembrane receptor protein
MAGSVRFASVHAMACIALMLAVSSRSNAQIKLAASEPEESGNKLEEIVVSAEKRSETLLQAPVTVAVIGANDLKNNDATDLSKIAEMVPQVAIGSISTGTGALISIRGMSSSPLDAGIDQSVSVVLDDVQLSRGRIITQAMFDMKQVEVLEGPQALFFGKNSPAGVIAVQSNAPTNSLDAYARAGYEFEADERYIEGAISGPITDTFKVRFAARASDMNGFIRNVATSQADPFSPGLTLPGAWDRYTPDGHRFAGRLIAEWTPTDTFTATARITMGTERVNSGSGNVEIYCKNGLTGPTVLGVPDTQADCALNQQMSVSALPPQLAVNYRYGNGGVPYSTTSDTLASITLNQKLGDITLTSVTGYYGQRVADSGVFDQSSFAQVYDAEFERYGLISQELRAVSALPGPLNYTAGVYLDHSTRFHFNSPFLTNVGVNPASGNYTAMEQNAWNGGNTLSAFGQGRWAILDSLELAVGARWTYEKKDINIGNTTLNPAYVGVFRDAGAFIGGNYGDHNISPEATVTWHPASDMTLYAAYKTGYKSGGFSNTATLGPTYDADTLAFRHELTKGEEVGFKSELLNRTLRVQLSAYRYTYSGLQVTAYDPAIISYTIRNAANARTQGVEGSFEWAAGHGFFFNGAAGYLHARYLDFPGAQCYAAQTPAEGCVGGQQNLGGTPLVLAPNVSYNLNGRYVQQLPAGFSAEVALGGSYTGAEQLAADGDPFQVQGSFWKLNSSLRLMSPNETWSLAFIGRNLTNAYYAVASNGVTFGAPNQYAGYFNRPRELIVEVGYHY